jgi:hypothetical protein
MDRAGIAHVADRGISQYGGGAAVYAVPVAHTDSNSNTNPMLSAQIKTGCAFERYRRKACEGYEFRSNRLRYPR